MQLTKDYQNYLYQEKKYIYIINDFNFQVHKNNQLLLRQSIVSMKKLF
jgi:hypothetical protein